jgi:acyl-CoA synthetase (NDP forming)
MSSTKGQDTSMQAALAALEAIASSRPSPADRFNIDRDGPAKRAIKLRALQQRFQKLNEYCDETAAEIRASLERTPPR